MENWTVLFLKVNWGLACLLEFGVVVRATHRINQYDFEILIGR